MRPHRLLFALLAAVTAVGIAPLTAAAAQPSEQPAQSSAIPGGIKTCGTCLADLRPRP